MKTVFLPPHDATATEVELKLAIPPRALARVRNHALLRGKGSRRRVRSVYYDTPEFDLWQHGVAFRVRRDGRHWLQALKGGGSASSGLHRRMELESEISGPHPDFAMLDAMPGAAAILPPAWCARLLPAFTTDFVRTSKKIKLNQYVTIDVAVDHGTIVSGGRSAPICELELERIAGPASGLFDFALRLLDDLPLAIENRSKAERGYALARNAIAQPVKAHAAALAADDSAIAAFKAMVSALLAQMQTNRLGALQGEDIEYLHQLRVALRRLRSMLGAYRKLLGKSALAPLNVELKWLARALGPARDADVFATEIWPPLRAALAASPLLTTLDAVWDAQQRRSAATARRALAARRYQRMMLGFGRWLAADSWREHAYLEARAFACHVLKRRDAHVRDYGHTLVRCDAEKLHRLRIEVKKLRYAADAFGALFDTATVNDMLKALSRLQDILGKMNDIRVAERLISAALTAKRGRAVMTLRAQLDTWRDERSTALRRKLNAAWRAYCRCKKFW